MLNLSVRAEPLVVRCAVCKVDVRSSSCTYNSGRNVWEIVARCHGMVDRFEGPTPEDRPRPIMIAFIAQAAGLNLMQEDRDF